MVEDLVIVNPMVTNCYYLDTQITFFVLCVCREQCRVWREDKW